MYAAAVMRELAALGTERTKKMYIANGAREPLFGVATGAMKPLSKTIQKNQALAEQLYATGNYDAMYFAGIIADPAAMAAEDFQRWMDAAYFYMISDYVVAVTLAEADIAQEVADIWTASGQELRMSGGWSCYCWLLGNRPDSEFDADKLTAMLRQATETIREAPPRTMYAMNYFIYTVATSYAPLHQLAVEAADRVGPLEVKRDGKKSSTIHAAANIQKFLARSKVGFKRKYVRC